MLWKKKKFIIMSSFCFCHIVFNSVKKCTPLLIQINHSFNLKFTNQSAANLLFTEKSKFFLRYTLHLVICSIYENTFTLYPFPSYRRFLTPLKQMTFENTHDEQFLLLPQCLQFHSIIMLSFNQVFHLCVGMFKNCRFVVRGKASKG